MVKYGGEIAMEVLISGLEAMEFVPEPLLQGLAKTFLAIWRAVKSVTVSPLLLTNEIRIYE